MALLARLALDRPETRAWALYDWGVSAFQTTIMTAVFPIWFQKGLGGTSSSFTLATTIALVVAALVGPVLGALVDVRPWKKSLVAAGAFVGAGAVAGLALAGPGDWLFAAVLFGLANLAAVSAQVGYDALLPHVARGGEADRLSSAGYALGYLGGGLLLAFHLAIVQKPAAFGLPSTSAAMAVVFVTVAAWWLVFARPLLARVREPEVAAPAAGAPAAAPVRAAFANLRQLTRELRRYRQAFLLLVAFLVYNDGVTTIIRLATTYGTEIGIPTGAQIGAILIVQFVGIPFTFAFGQLAGKIGARAAILGGLSVYGAISILGYFMTTATHFYILAGLVGLVQGGVQALSRSLFARLTPPSRSGEFFGLFGVFEKFASILGPLVFYVAIQATGSARSGILAVISFFVVGGLLLTRVDLEAGEREAAAVDAKAH